MITMPRQAYDEAGQERTLLPAGRYLVDVLAALEDAGGEYLTLRYAVVASDQAVPAGTVGDERFYLTPKSLKRLGILLKRLGVMERGEPTDDVVSFEPLDLVNRRLVVDVVHEQLQAKSGEHYTVHKWGFEGFWDHQDPRVAGFFSAPPRAAAPTQNANGARQGVPAGADDEV